MKFLYLHRTQARDGQRVHIDELIGALRRQGHEVRIVEPSPLQGGGAARRRMPKAAHELLELAYNAVELRALAVARRDFDPDAVYVRHNLHLHAGAWIARRCGVPLLLEVNAPLAAERAANGGLALERVARRSEAASWRAADAVLPVTAALADHVREAGVDPARIHVAPNGVDLERFQAVPSSDDAKARLGLSGRIVLGFVGYMRPWHGLDRALRFLASPSAPADAILYMVGDGPARAGLEEQARALGIAGRVRFAGAVGRDAMPAHAAAFDVALQPDVTPYASPLKLFEYLALGKPVVAPDKPNIREILADGETGFLFDPAQEGALAARLGDALADAGARARVGHAGRALIDARDYTWDGAARRVANLAQAVARRRSLPSAVAEARR